MANKELTIKCSKGIISLINQIETTTYGSSDIAQMTFEEYGGGQVGFDAFKEDFKQINLDGFLEEAYTPVKLKNLKSEYKDLEDKHVALTKIFGENGEANEGSLAFVLLKKLESEIEELIGKRDKLKGDSDQADIDYSNKLIDIEKKRKEAITLSNKMVADAQNEAKRTVTLIEKFTDFLSETNKNMWLYAVVIVLVVCAVGFTVAYSIPELLTSFESYNEYVKNLNVKAGSMPIINYAFGILIVKLPWALCLSAVFTGAYSLIKGLLVTYEKINQDKRNMSAIYSVSGNVAQALNEYGLVIAQEQENPETEDVHYVINRSKPDIERKRESLKWNQIINYFERMQSHVNEDPKNEDETSQVNYLKGVVKSLIDKGITKI